MKRPYANWGEVFRASVRRGDDHGYAAFLADNWLKRQKKKTAKGELKIVGKDGKTVIFKNAKVICGAT